MITVARLVLEFLILASGLCVLLALVAVASAIIGPEGF